MNQWRVRRRGDYPWVRRFPESERVHRTMKEMKEYMAAALMKADLSGSIFEGVNLWEGWEETDGK